MARRNKRTTLADWIPAIVCILVGLGVLFLGNLASQKENRFIEHGQQTEAAVIEVKRVSKRSGGKRKRTTTSYCPIVSFTNAEGQLQQASSLLSTKAHRNLKPGDKVTIYYLPENKEEVLLQGDSNSGSYFMIMLLGGIFTAVGGGITIRNIRK